MKKITIIGWSVGAMATVEELTYWPDEMSVYLAIAKAAQATELDPIENILSEEIDSSLSGAVE